MRTFNPKDPAEIVVLTFDFTADLGVGETLTGNPTVSINQYSGTADPGTSGMTSGAAQLSGALVLQKVGGGVSGNDYFWEATCATSTGRTLVIGGRLPVLSSYLQ
jgi:hypothetical protein